MDDGTILALGLVGIALAGAAGYYLGKSGAAAAKLPPSPIPAERNPRALPELMTLSLPPQTRAPTPTMLPLRSYPLTEAWSSERAWDDFLHT